MKDKALNTISQYHMLQKGDRVVLGVSGGADSMALCCLLLSLRESLHLTLAVCHINHRLRGWESDRDEQFVHDFCARNSLPFYAMHCDIAALAQQKKCGVEACGRSVRYRFFAQTAEDLGPGTKIATAHNAEDNTETLFLHLMRGCGPDGLCGIPPVRGNIIRPLIACSRQEIEAYLMSIGQSYVVDSTNQDTQYRRNLLRQDILPRLRAQAPELDRSLHQLSALCREQRDFVKEVVRREYNALLRDGALPKKALLERNIYLQREILAAFFKENHIELSFKLIDAALSAAKHGHFPLSLPGGRALYCSQTGLLYLSSPTLPPPVPFRPTLGSHRLPDGSLLRLSLLEQADFQRLKENFPEQLKNCLNYAIIKDDCLIRARKSEDRILLFPRLVTKTLKKLFNEAKIPVEKRDIIPLLARGNQVLWVPNLGIDASAAVSRDTERILFLELFENAKETETKNHGK